MSIKKINIGGFAGFKLSLYSTVLFSLNNSAGKFSSEIKSEYDLGKVFLLRQKGHSHTLAFAEKLNKGEIIEPQRHFKGSYSNKDKLSFFMRGL